MYVVVGCRACHALWVVDGRPETTQCPRCQIRHQFTSLTQFIETESRETAVQARSSMLAQRADGHDVDPAAIDLDTVGIDDASVLREAGFDPETITSAAEQATANSSSTSTPSRKETVLSAIETLENPTTEAITTYATSTDLSETDVARTLEKLRQTGDITKHNDTYRVL